MNAEYAETPWSDRVEDLLAQLCGLWSISRKVSGQASLNGNAQFTPALDGEFLYREKGVLRLHNGDEFNAERGYVFRGNDGGFAVFFDEMPRRLFHEVTLRKSTHPSELIYGGDAVHLCGQDIYASSYHFKKDGTFFIRHDVTGPRKEYVMTTNYVRLLENSKPLAVDGMV